MKKSLSEKVSETKEGFIRNMDDDFNSAGALGMLFELVRMINVARDAGATRDELNPAQDLLRELTGVWGLSLEADVEKSSQTAADPFVQMLIDLRLTLRKEKNWALSDQIRDDLKANGVVLEDSKDATQWHWA